MASPVNYLGLGTSPYGVSTNQQQQQQQQQTQVIVTAPGGSGSALGSDSGSNSNISYPTASLMNFIAANNTTTSNSIGDKQTSNASAMCSIRLSKFVQVNK